MDRAKKEQLVVELNETFADATLVVVTHQSGLTVKESTDLRRRMREASEGSSGGLRDPRKNRDARPGNRGWPVPLIHRQRS